MIFVDKHCSCYEMLCLPHCSLLNNCCILLLIYLTYVYDFTLQLLAHNHLCYVSDCYVWFMFLLYVVLKMPWIISFMFAIVPFYLLFWLWGILLAFPIFRLHLIFCTMSSIFCIFPCFFNAVIWPYIFAICACPLLFIHTFFIIVVYRTL